VGLLVGLLIIMGFLMEYLTIILMEYPTRVGLFMGLLMDCYHINGSYDGRIFRLVMERSELENHHF
jgi:hypothetical protein